MPTAERYARYREDQTTIWVSKTAAAFLQKERERPNESSGSVLDRLIAELRRTRRGTGGAAAKGAATKAAGTKGAARKSAAKKKSAGAATRSRSRA